ncbi:hypothetical protein QBC43DRAFT_352750 [Cladorrhinum sp. PSN259]|nr:hypothetical protein QBC43DRAFT_352750 [Cladorrhinum sp. PSN259]
MSAATWWTIGVCLKIVLLACLGYLIFRCYSSRRRARELQPAAAVHFHPAPLHLNYHPQNLSSPWPQQHTPNHQYPGNVQFGPNLQYPGNTDVSNIPAPPPYVAVPPAQHGGYDMGKP